MPISYFNHEGTKIMFADYTECKEPQQQLDLLDEVANKMKTMRDVYLLVDYNGITAGPHYMSKLKEYGNTVFNKHMKCCGVLGIHGLKKILFNGYSRATGAKNIKAVDTREDALAWMIQYEE